MKPFSLIFISLLLAFVYTQDCNNPLLAVFDLQGLSEPQSGSGLAYCSNLQNGQTCCSSETVQGFQQRLDNLTTSLQDLAGQRDIYITELNSNYTHQYQRIADDLSDYDDEVRRIKNQTSLTGEAISSQFSFLLWLDDRLDTIDDNFTRAFRDYQDKRQACFQTLLQIQASAWCLACDPNYAALGVNEDGTVNASPGVCTAIQRDCTPFLLGNNNLNPLFQAQQAYRRLTNLTDYLRAYRDGGNVLPDTILEDEPLDAQAFQRTSSVPDNCNASSCEWQCSNLFSPQYVLNSTIAANGAGVIGGRDVTFSNIPFQVPVPVQNQSRLLQQISEWTPDLGSTGLNYNIAADPADARSILPPNDDTDNTDDYITDHTDDTDGLVEEHTWSDHTDNDPTDNDLTDNEPDFQAPDHDTTDHDPTDHDFTDTDNDDRDRILQNRNRRSDSSDTDNDPTDNDNTDNDDSDSDRLLQNRNRRSDSSDTDNDHTDNDPTDKDKTDTDDSDSDRALQTRHRRSDSSDTDNDPTDNDNTDNDDSDSDRLLQNRNRRSDSSDTDNDHTDNDPTDKDKTDTDNTDSDN